MVSSSAYSSAANNNGPDQSQLPQEAKLHQSSIGKKLLTGITGLVLVTFVIVHMLGNLTLFYSTTAYNQLAYFIDSCGPLLYVIEAVLLLSVCVHIAIGINIQVRKRQARQASYAFITSAGDPSRQTLSSRTMIVSGLLLGLFLIHHLATFKFAAVYRLPGSNERDLARLVFETFQSPIYTAGYVLVLSVLGLHLRHGIWSALQSLGVATKPSTFVASAVLGGAIALGFIGLPLAIYFKLVG